MGSRLKKKYICFTLICAIVWPFLLAMNVYAIDKVVETFYVLDEDGNPFAVEITQGDLEQASQEQQPYVMAASLEDTPSLVDTEETIGIVRFKRDATTFDYTEVDTGRTGYLSSYVTADAAYISTETDGVICKVSGVKIKVALDDVAGIESYEDNTVNRYYISDTGYLIHTYGYYSGSTLTTASTRVGYNPGYLVSGKNYYSYDGHYFYESFETMIHDYRNDTYTNAVNTSNPYYNYYQYLSFHTEASFTGAEYDDYVSSVKGSSSDSVMLDTGDAFVNVQNTYTINSLLMFGIAINESGWGTSSIAKTKNNLFGLNAVDSSAYESADIFKSLEACIEDFAYGWIHTGYLDGIDYRYRGPHLGDKHSGINVSYASDPYWGEKGASRGYYYDTEKEDYGKYTIGIATSGKINLYKEANTSSTVIYTSATASGGNLYDYPVIVLDTVTNSSGEEFYKIVSDMSLLADRSGRNVEAVYDSSRDYVYVKASDIEIVFSGTGDEVEIPDSEEEVVAEKTHAEVIKHLGLTNSSNYLTGFEFGGNISTVIGKVKALSDTITVVAKDKSGSQVTKGILASSMTLIVTTNGSTETYWVVIRGDVTGDGQFSALDYVKLRNYIDGVTTLSGVYLKSADTSGDGKVSALDYVKLRNHMDNKSTIVQ